MSLACPIVLKLKVTRFLFCRLLSRPAFLVRVLLGAINNVPFFLAKIAIVTHLRMKLRICVVPKNLVGLFLRL